MDLYLLLLPELMEVVVHRYESKPGGRLSIGPLAHQALTTFKERLK